jgi:hypothetical protein
MVSLILLVENSLKSKEEFLQANGIAAAVVAAVNLKADSLRRNENFNNEAIENRSQRNVK